MYSYACTIPIFQKICQFPPAYYFLISFMVYSFGLMALGVQLLGYTFGRSALGFSF